MNPATNNIVLIGDKAKDLFLHFLPGFQFKEFNQSNKFRFHKIRTQHEDGTINDFTLIVIDRISDAQGISDSDPSIQPGFPVSGIYSQRVGRRTTSDLRCKFVICESDPVKLQSWMDDIIFRTNEKPTIITAASVQEALDPINKLLLKSPKSISPLGQCYSRQTFYYDGEATELRKLLSQLDNLILEDDVDLGNYGVFNIVISKVGVYSVDLQNLINDHLKPTKQYWVEIPYLHWFRFNKYNTTLEHKEDYHRVPSDFVLFNVFIPNAHFCSENQPLIDFLKDIQDRIPFVKFFRRASIAGESSLPELKGRVPNVNVYVPPKHKQLLIDYLNERQIFYIIIYDYIF